MHRKNRFKNINKILKKNILIIVMLILLCPILTISYADFIIKTDTYRSNEMYIAELLYSMKIDSADTYTLTLPVGESEHIIEITSLNKIASNYKLIYKNNDNVKIEYASDYKDKAVGLITNTRTIMIRITNNSSTSQTLTLGVTGGYSFNEIKDINVPNGYKEINIDYWKYDYETTALYVDNKRVDELDKTKNYELISYTCTNDEAVNYNYSDKSILVKPLTKQTKCSLYFNILTKYIDPSGATSPELYQGLVPVTYNNGNIEVADLTKEWFNYDKHNWANAVLVDYSNANVKNKYFNGTELRTDIIGQTVSMDEIKQMYVWIPRYKYKLWNAEEGVSNPQQIEIIFEDKSVNKSNGIKNGTYLTHPAFTFGTKELNGYWVGKFEPSSDDAACYNSPSTTNCNKTIKLNVKPNAKSLTYQTISNEFNSSRAIEETYASSYNLNKAEIDTHMMKNMEWGAVAYLSHSKYGRYNSNGTCISSGCEIWINNVITGTLSNYPPSITGCAGTSVSASVKENMSTCESGRAWNSAGINASTTGNMYGIYDMSGGVWERMMSGVSDANGKFIASSSGFSSEPSSLYFEKYPYSANEYDWSKGRLGDASKETMKSRPTSTGTNAWYGDWTRFPGPAFPWWYRGGGASNGSAAGAFFFSVSTGGAYSDDGFRSVLSAQSP